MGAADDINDFISAIIGLFVFGIILYAFYNLPAPLGDYFRSLINSVIVGVIFVGVIAIIAIIVLKALESNQRH